MPDIFQCIEQHNNVPFTAQKLNEFIASGIDINAILNSDGHSPLTYAASKGYKDIVYILLAADLSQRADMKNLEGQSSALSVEQAMDPTKMLRIDASGKLIPPKCESSLFGISVDIPEDWDNLNSEEQATQYLLRNSARGDDLNEINTLLDAGANINAQNSDGRTAIDIAISFMQIRKKYLILQRLLDSQQAISKEAATRYLLLLHRHPFQHNGQRPHPAYVHFSHILIEKGAVIPPDHIIKLLLQSISLGDIPMVNLLIAQGADLNAEDNYGITALLVAAHNQRPEMMEFLLKKKIELRATDKERFPDLSNTIELFKINKIVSKIHKVAVILGVSRNPKNLEQKFMVQRGERRETILLGENTSYRGAEALEECLEKYLTLNPDNEPMKRIVGSVTMNRKLYSAQVTLDTLLEKYKCGEIIMLTSGWSSHAIGVVLYKSKLIISNRGDGMDGNHGVHIYEIDPAKIDMKYLKKIYRGDDNPAIKNGDMKIFFNNLKSIILPSPPAPKPILFENKDQAPLSCWFAGIKSSIQGILFLLKKEELEKEGRYSPSDIQKRARSYAYREYKNFTKTMRDTALNELIENINTSEYQQYYIALALTLLNNARPALEIHPKAFSKIDRFLKLSKALDEIDKKNPDTITKILDVNPDLKSLGLNGIYRDVAKRYEAYRYVVNAVSWTPYHSLLRAQVPSQGSGVVNDLTVFFKKIFPF